MRTEKPCLLLICLQLFNLLGSFDIDILTKEKSYVFAKFACCFYRNDHAFYFLGRPRQAGKEEKLPRLQTTGHVPLQTTWHDPVAEYGIRYDHQWGLHATCKADVFDIS